jgi:hypothetical protein
MLDKNDLDYLGKLFVKSIKRSLDSNVYPYSPGFNNNRKSQGVSDKVASGSLYDSVEYVVNEEDQTVSVLMNDYWRSVNFGREPGKYVPIKPLEEWATLRIKGLKSDKEARSIAFGISKNIYKFGIKPTNFYDNAYNIFEKLYGQQVENYVEDKVYEFFEQLIEEDIKTT